MFCFYFDLQLDAQAQKITSVQLLCSRCKRPMMGVDDKYVTTVRDGDEASAIARALAQYNECNGDILDIKCHECRKQLGEYSAEWQRFLEECPTLPRGSLTEAFIKYLTAKKELVGDL